MPKLTQEDLKKLLHYNSSTGAFTWMFTNTGHREGTTAGTMSSGYIVIRSYGKLYKAHRLAFLYMEGEVLASNIDVDHINGVKWDNRWNNLRKATRPENCYNQKTNSSNLVGIKGVSYSEYPRPRYSAEVMSEGHRYGTTMSVGKSSKQEVLERCIKWVESKREELHGQFTNHGVRT